MDTNANNPLKRKGVDELEGSNNGYVRVDLT